MRGQITVRENLALVRGQITVRENLALVCGWRKKKRSLVHTVCACLVSPGFLRIWKFP